MSRYDDNKYPITICMVTVVGVAWAFAVGAMRQDHYTRRDWRDTEWVSECAQHRPLVECDRDLATLKARK